MIKSPQNHFKTLEQQPRPWLEIEPLKSTFHRKAAALHPDHSGEDAETFAALNTAYQTLRDPASRVRHLLELTNPEALAAIPPTAPDELADLFLEMASECRRLGEFGARQAAATSAIARAGFSSERRTRSQQAELVLSKIETAYTAAFAELCRLDEEWPAPEAVAALAMLHPKLAYLSRWLGQMREALLKLEL